MMFFELNTTVYSRWPCAPADNTKRTRPSGLATVTSAAAGSERQNRMNGYRMVGFIGLLDYYSAEASVIAMRAQRRWLAPCEATTRPPALSRGPDAGASSC